MEMYFMKSVACLAILLLFYKLLLEKENMHVFKRFYLLASPVISVAIPAITFPEYVVISTETSNFFIETSHTSKSTEFPLFETILFGIYILGALFFGSWFVLNLRSLLITAKTNPKIELTDAKQVLVKDIITPYTFWSYIYLNREKYQKKQIPQEVLDHELAHVRQKHTADILFLELLQVIFWFLPLIYLLKKAIKLNHEFLADSEVLKKSDDPKHYQHILLSFSSGKNLSLVNSINYQSIKKRFTVMKKRPSKKVTLVRYFLFLPLLAGLLYSFSSTKTVVQNVTSPEHQNAVVEQPEKNSLLQVDNHDQEKATPAMIKEYNELARDYKKNGLRPDHIESDEFRRMKYIYGLMTPDQRNSAESFPPPPPPTLKEKERAAIKQEREMIKEERKAARQAREMERVEKHELEIERQAEMRERRAEKRELEIERRRKNGEVSPPPPPPAPPVQKDGEVPPPPPVPEHVDIPAPPPPASPMETFEDWIEEGAEFYLDGKKISGQEALNVVQKNMGKNLHIRVNENDSGKTVKISTKKKKNTAPGTPKTKKSNNLKSTFIGPPREQDLKRSC